MAYVSSFLILSFDPRWALDITFNEMCFTSSEREHDGGKWELSDFDDYMLSACPAPYRPDHPSDLWPNATVGQLHWGGAWP